jgi:hypothetical protein
MFCNEGTDCSYAVNSDRLYAGNLSSPLTAFLARRRRSDCPGGAGKFGFNTYNLLTFLLMSFNQVQKNRK